MLISLFLAGQFLIIRLNILARLLRMKEQLASLTPAGGIDGAIAPLDLRWFHCGLLFSCLATACHIWDTGSEEGSGQHRCYRDK